MSDSRPAVKLDFTSGLDQLPPRPKVDASTTQASVIAGRELGFSGRVDPVRLMKESPVPATPVERPVLAFDGRRLRSRGANVQLNLKVTADEKEAILRDAARLIQDPASPVGNIGEFVVFAINFYRQNHTR